MPSSEKKKEPAILGNYPEPSDISNQNNFFIISRIECWHGYFVLYVEKKYIKRGIFPPQLVFFKFKRFVRLLYILHFRLIHLPRVLYILQCIFDWVFMTAINMQTEYSYRLSDHQICTK